MSLELYYTSAPRGLVPGSKGYCTVAATKGLSSVLRQKLEGLSILPAQCACALSHLVVSVGGRSYNVLSRVCSVEGEYSGRDNKFAHHLVLEASELPPGGPAWLLRQPGMMRTAWDGRVGELPPRALPQGDAPPAVCRAWQDQSGDAGWGGVWAEGVHQGAKGSALLLHGPDCDPLLLFAEALALLPPRLRWATTFCTHYSKALAGEACLWRALPASLPEAKASKRSAPGPILDLSGPLAAPPKNTPLVVAARTGQLVESQPVEEEPVLPAPSLEPRIIPAPAPAMGLPFSQPPGAVPFPSGEKPEVKKARPIISMEDEEDEDYRKPKGKRKKVGRSLAIAAASFFLGLLVASGGGALLGFRFPGVNPEGQNKQPEVKETKQKIKDPGQKEKEAQEKNQNKPGGDGSTTEESKKKLEPELEKLKAAINKMEKKAKENEDKLKKLEKQLGAKNKELENLQKEKENLQTKLTKYQKADDEKWASLEIPFEKLIQEKFREKTGSEEKLAKGYGLKNDIIKISPGLIFDIFEKKHEIKYSSGGLQHMEIIGFPEKNPTIKLESFEQKAKTIFIKPKEISAIDEERYFIKLFFDKKLVIEWDKQTYESKDKKEACQKALINAVLVVTSTDGNKKVPTYYGFWNKLNPPKDHFLPSGSLYYDQPDEKKVTIFKIVDNNIRFDVLELPIKIPKK